VTRRALNRLAIRDARKAARADHLDRRIPVLDRDFDQFI
jgi:hypothetical protein